MLESVFTFIRYFGTFSLAGLSLTVWLDTVSKWTLTVVFGSIQIPKWKIRPPKKFGLEKTIFLNRNFNQIENSPSHVLKKLGRKSEQASLYFTIALTLNTTIERPKSRKWIWKKFGLEKTNLLCQNFNPIEKRPIELGEILGRKSEHGRAWFCIGFAYWGAEFDVNQYARRGLILHC